MSLGLALVISSSPLFSGSALGLWLGCECSLLWPAKFCCPLPPVWAVSSLVEPEWGARTEPDPGPHALRADRKGGGPHRMKGRGMGTPTEDREASYMFIRTMCVSEVQVNSVPVHLYLENLLDVTEAKQRPAVRLHCGVTSVVSSCLICSVLYMHPTITTSYISQIFSYE